MSKPAPRRCSSSAATPVGKTSVSYRLAPHFGVAITEVDDFQVMLERMTTPEQQPALHWWRLQPNLGQLPATVIMEQALEIGLAMAVGHAFEGVLNR